MESPGERLKKLRLEKGISLEEAHQKTKLHLNIIKAIEENSLINFSPVYIKGFLKIYCKFLGVEPRDYMSDYKEPKNIARDAQEVSQKPSSPSILKRYSQKFLFLKAIRIKPKTILIIILSLFFTVGLFKLGKYISKHPFSKRSLVSRKIKPAVALSPKIESKEQITKLPSPSIAKIIRLDIRAKENCFIQVKSDGKVIFQNILRKGRSESWQARDKIELSLGNAGFVELEVNGSRISSLGKKGQALKNILITKEGLSVKR